MQGLAMIHAPRGIGKTHVALGTAWAVAAGGGFSPLDNSNGGTFRVVLFDGEMPGRLLQERLARVVKASGLNHHYRNICGSLLPIFPGTDCQTWLIHHPTNTMPM